MALKKKRAGVTAHEDKITAAQREEFFCLEYSKDQNATRSAIAAGYSEKSAAEIGCRLLRKVKIQDRLKKIIEDRKARTLLEGDEILLEIKKLATSDIRRLMDPKTGCLLPPKDWPDDIAHAVAGLEVHEKYHPVTGTFTGYVKKVKLWDKPKPQEMLGRNKALFTDVVKSEVKATVVTASEAEVKETLAAVKRKL